MSMDLRALVFDLDGVIVDTESAEFDSWRRVYEHHQALLDFDAWSVCIGTQNAFDPYEHLCSQLGRTVPREDVRAMQRALLEEALSTLTPLPGVHALLDDAAARGLRLGIASSSTRRWVDDALARVRLRSRFDHLSCYGDGLSAKPAPDLYVEAVRALGVTAATAIAIEDSPNGIAAAKAAGLFCVAVPNPMTVRLSMDEADLVLSSLTDLDLDAV